jgi:cellulose synthase/poly-beta-1,6-N-acetylglucosamine synthase-like glycosyltransferase
MSGLGLFALLAALTVFVPCAILALECLAACLPERKSRLVLVRVPQMVVLVPAHNEEECLPEALRSIEPEIGEGDRILVVAHNCSDRTAMIARARGAEAIEVRDAGTGGKPDALKAGLAHLDADPPEVVVIVDADCRVERGALRTLALAAADYGGPVQGDYRFRDESLESFGSLSSLALLVKNVARPHGLTRLGLPCLLNGAGSAYPFAQLRAAPHGEGSIAEDYQLSIDLARAGHPTRFVPEARIASVLPARRDAALRQRKRWEHGHLTLVLFTAPRLVLEGLLKFDRNLCALGADLLVPPLAFLALGWMLAAGLAFLAFGLEGESAAAWLVLAAGALAFLGVGRAVSHFAGFRALVQMLTSAPRYVLSKLPLYLAFFGRRETRWRKTERTSAPNAPPADENQHERSQTGS